MADTRSQILAAARSIFEAEGMEGVSMRRIAADVGITATAIYRHFADKQALLGAIVESGFDKLVHAMRKAGKGKSGQQALLEIMLGYVDFGLAFPAYYQSMFIQPRADQRRYPEDFRARESLAFNVVYDAVEAAMKQGELIEDDPLEVTLSAWAHGHGLVSLYQNGRFGDHPRRFRKQSRASLQRLLDGLCA